MIPGEDQRLARTMILKQITWLLLFPAVLTFFIGEATSEAEEQEKQQIVPDAVQVAIERFFPGSTLVVLNDLEEGLRQEFADGYPERNPAFISSDFDGNGHLDYALLLRGKKSGRAIVILAVLLQAPKGKFKAMSLEAINEFLESVFIRVRAPGKVQEHDSKKAIIIRVPGIERSFFEKSAGVFYWDEGRFRFVATAD